MRFIQTLAFWGMVALPHAGLACEPPAIFYEPLSVKAGASGNPTLNTFVRQNAPQVRSVHLGRGTAAQQSLCGGQGYVTLELAMPDGAAFGFDQVGFEIRVVEGQFPDHALPTGPVISAVGPDSEFSVLGSWFEGPPSRHKTIDAVAEVMFVAPDGTRGPPARITLFSEVKKTDSGEDSTR